MTSNFAIQRPDLGRDIKLDKNVRIEMRDGILLAADIYRPNLEGLYPALLSMSPYIKEMQQLPPGLSHSIEAGATSFYVSQGYAHIIASIRGTGFSQGQYNYYDMKEQQDGYDLVEWIAGQPWCNGNVGMIGDSYFGKIQYLVAAQQPPNLKCIVPYDAGTDQYRDVAYKGGVMWSQFVSMWGVDTITQCLWPGPVEGKLPPANFILDLASHTDDGPYYWERSAWTKSDKITVPLMSIVPLSAVHTLGQLRIFPEIRAPKKLLVVPPPDPFAEHVLFIESNPLNEQILRWLDYWLKEIDTGIMKEPMVTLFDAGTGTWHYGNEYPFAETKWTKFFFRSNNAPASTASHEGSLSLEPPVQDESPDKYVTLSPDPSDFTSLLTYSTTPMGYDLRVWGPLSLHLNGASTAADTIWFIKLADVAPDGNIKIITEGHLRASYREIDEGKSLPGQPFHPFCNPNPQEPNAIYDFQIEMRPIFHTFKKGHRIWLSIGSNDLEYQGKIRSNYIFQSQPAPGENVVYHDTAHQTHLLLPVIPELPIKDPVGSPVSEIKWPL